MRKTKENAEKTKQAILDAAIECFSEHGVAKTTLEQIAKSAKVTRGAIYWHFTSKQDIFEALHDRLHLPFIESITEGLEGVTSNAIMQLEKVCTELLIEIEINAEKQKILTLFLLRCDYSGELTNSKERFNEKKKLKNLTLSKYFDKAVEQGILPSNTDSMLLTIGISAYLRGIVVEYLEDPDLFSMKDNAAKFIALFFANIK